MKICFLHLYARSPTESTTSTRHYSIAKNLIKKGHEVLILCGSYDQRKESQMLSSNELLREFQIDGVKFVRARMPLRKKNFFGLVSHALDSIFFVIKNFRLIRQWQPNVLIGCSPHLISAFTASVLSKIYKIPFIFEVRDIWPLSLRVKNNFYAFHPFYWTLKAVELLTYFNSIAVIHIASHFEKYLDKFLLKKKLIFLPNGIDMDLVNINSVKKKNKKFTVYYIGSIGPINSIDILFKAINFLNNDGYQKKIEFRFIGDGSLKKFFKLQAIELGFKNIIFEDAVPKKDIYKKVANADLFWANLKDNILYSYGNSTTKIPDYMMLGRPIIIGANVPYSPIQQAKCGKIIKADDYVQIAKAVISYYHMKKSELNLIGGRGNKWIARHYDYKLLVNKLNCFLRKI